MDSAAKRRLKKELGKIESNALYVLVDTHSGLLLEDVGPLLSSLESAYRKLIVLNLDKNIRQLLQLKQEKAVSAAGVSRSINSRYEKIMLSRDLEYSLTSEEKKLRKPATYDLPPIKPSKEYELLPEPGSRKENRQFIPNRIELARTHVSSPGFIELLGDPVTLSALTAILAALVVIRGQNINRIFSLKETMNDTARTLIALGYTKEEILSVTEYLESDLTQIITELENSKSRLVPGDDIDPSNSNKSNKK